MAGRKADASARACPLQTYLSYVGKKAHFVKRGKTEGYVVRRFFLRAAGGAGIQMWKDAGQEWRERAGGEEVGRTRDGAGRWADHAGEGGGGKTGAFLPVRGTEDGHGMRGRNGWRRLFTPTGRLMVACPGAASSLPTRMLLAGVFRKGAADGKARAGERNARGGIVRAD